MTPGAKGEDSEPKHFLLQVSSPIMETEGWTQQPHSACLGGPQDSPSPTCHAFVPSPWPSLAFQEVIFSDN